MRRAAIMVVGAMLLAVGLPALRSSVAADTPLHHEGSGFALDLAHGHLFVPDRRDGHDTVLVTSLRGDVVASVGSFSSAGTPVLTHDGSAVLVPLGKDDAVAVIDTETFALRTVATGDATCPSQIAETAS